MCSTRCAVHCTCTTIHHPPPHQAGSLEGGQQAGRHIRTAASQKQAGMKSKRNTEKETIEKADQRRTEQMVLRGRTCCFSRTRASSRDCCHRHCASPTLLLPLLPPAPAPLLPAAAAAATRPQSVGGTEAAAVAPEFVLVLAPAGEEG